QHVHDASVHALTINHLRWTADDIIQQGRVDAERAHYLVERYSGMAASLRLAIDPRLQSDASADKQADRTFLQLMQSFLGSQTLKAQHLLLTAATVETITPRISGTHFRLPDLMSYLKQLHADHMLVSRTTDGYQLHALFRDFLQQQLKTTYPERFTQLHIQAAHWFEGQDKVEQAIEHYIAAEVWQQAIRLGEMVAAEWHKCGNWQSLLYINQLLLHQPTPRLRLLSATALCDMNRVVDSHAQLNEAERLYKAQGNEDAVLKVIVHRAHNFAWEGDYALAYDLLAPYEEDDTPPRLTQAWIARTLGRIYLGQGLYDKAIQALERAVALLGDGEKGYGQSQYLQDLSEAYIRKGEVQQGIAILQDVVALLRKSTSPIAEARALNNLAVAFMNSGYYAEADTTLADAEHFLPDPYSRTAGYIQQSRGDLYRDIGDWEMARYAYHQADAVATVQNTGNAELWHDLLLSRVRLAWWQMDFDAIEGWITIADIPDTPQTPAHHALHLWHIISTKQDAPHASVCAIEEHINALHDAKAWLELSKVVGAVTWFALRHTLDELQNRLWTLIGHLPDTLCQPLAVDVNHVALLREHLLSQADSWAKIVPYHAQLCNYQASLVLNASPVEYQSLYLRVLGTEKLTLSHTALPAYSWASPLSRAVFFCLYFYGAQNKTELTERLWHNYDVAKARNALRDVRKQLKTVLPDAVIYVDGKYQLNPAWEITSDYKQCHTLVERAKQLPERDPRTESLYLQALNLASPKGLLPQLDGEWLIPLRQRAEQDYLDALLGVAACATVREDYGMAIELYEQRLHHDPYNESLARLIMKT
ncbi:MAG: hypothetical protein AAFQ52_14290, partial [Chloroflexota bacterium]